MIKKDDLDPEDIKNIHTEVMVSANVRIKSLIASNLILENPYIQD